MTARTSTWTAAGASALVAIAVCVAGAGRAGLWPDELATLDAHTPAGALARATVRLLGASDAAVRLPFGLLAVLAAASLARAIGRVTDARAGTMSGVVYATLPLVFQNARAVSDAAVGESLSALAFATTLGALYASDRWLLRWIVCASFMAASAWAGGGALPIALAAALAVALQWNEARSGQRVACVALGAAGVALFAHPIVRGVATASFDHGVEPLAHATMPYAGLVAVALIAGMTRHGSRALARRLALLTAVLGYAAVVVCGSRMVAAPLAAATGIALRDLERGRRPAPMSALASALALLIVLRDLALFPATLYAAVAHPPAAPRSLDAWLAPASFAEFLAGNAPVRTYALIALAPFALSLVALSLGAGTVRVPSPVASRRALAVYEASHRTTSPWLRGRVRALVLAVACALTAGSLIGLSLARDSLATSARIALSVVAALPMALVLFALCVLVLVHAVVWLGSPRSRVGRVLGSRVALVPVAGFVSALGMAHGLGPALSRRMSPRDALSTLASVRPTHEPAARFADGTRNAARWYLGSDLPALDHEPDALAWLAAPDRRWLILGESALPSLDRAYRRATHRNIPVALSTGAGLLLATSDPTRATPSGNPLDTIVSTAPFPLDSAFVAQPGGGAVLDDAIVLLGADAPQGVVHAGGSFALRQYFHVLREAAGDWQVFVHVDGPCARVHGDHVPGDGRAPVSDWLAGDYVRDEAMLTMPAWCRPGRYTVFTGLFAGDRRMHVRGGERTPDDRIVAATFELR